MLGNIKGKPAHGHVIRPRERLPIPLRRIAHILSSYLDSIQMCYETILDLESQRQKVSSRDLRKIKAISRQHSGPLPIQIFLDVDSDQLPVVFPLIVTYSSLTLAPGKIFEAWTGPLFTKGTFSSNIDSDRTTLPHKNFADQGICPGHQAASTDSLSFHGIKAIHTKIDDAALCRKGSTFLSPYEPRSPHGVKERSLN